MKHVAHKLLGVLALASFPMAALAQVNMAVTQSIPTLDEVGLAGLVAAVGAVGGWILKKRSKK